MQSFGSLSSFLKIQPEPKTSCFGGTDLTVKLHEKLDYNLCFGVQAGRQEFVELGGSLIKEGHPHPSP